MFSETEESIPLIQLLTLQTVLGPTQIKMLKAIYIWPSSFVRFWKLLFKLLPGSASAQVKPSLKTDLALLLFDHAHGTGR